MKKLICFVLATVLMMTSAVALAETKTLDPQEKRGITLKSVGLNEVEEGISPTTGLTLSSYNVPDGFTGMAKTGRYLPMMAQIGNDDGGVGRRAQWGTAYADIIYETLLYRDYGKTRLTAVYNDVIPDSIGFIRSMRMAQVWLREEWGAAFMFHGQQTYDRANTVLEAKSLGYRYYDYPYFNGWAGYKDWDDYFTERPNTTKPFHKNVNAVGVYNLMTKWLESSAAKEKNYTIPNHAFKFTDEMPEGDTALHVRVEWKDLPSGYKDVYVYGSSLIYDVDSGCYLRYMRYGEEDLRPWVDRDEGSQIAFANVIVQFTKTEFPSSDAPIQYTIGKNHQPAEGNADFFMAGKHVSGYWRHESVTGRTVYYGPDGEEISLQRGKTLIILYPDDNVMDCTAIEGFGAGKVTYSDELPNFAY